MKAPSHRARLWIFGSIAVLSAFHGTHVIGPLFWGACWFLEYRRKQKRVEATPD